MVRSRRTARGGDSFLATQGTRFPGRNVKR